MRGQPGLPTVDAAGQVDADDIGGDGGQQNEEGAQQQQACVAQPQPLQGVPPVWAGRCN